MIAALYIDPRGPYPHMPGVDAWDEKRNAWDYEGPYPVIAHPPCGAWSSLRHLRKSLADAPCAVRALDQVRAWGGILEHPANSTFFDGNPPEAGECDKWGFTIEVQQCDWGHVARKRTWLYLVGIPFEAIVLPLKREPTHWCSGGGTGRGKPPPGIKICSAQQRRRTPPAFAEWLVALAEKARRPS